MTCKQKLIKFLVKVKEKKNCIVGAVAAATPFILSVGASAESSGSGSTYVAPSIADSVTGAMFNQILQQMVDLLPLLLPVVVSVIAFRKGISFLKSMIMGA